MGYKKILAVIGVFTLWGCGYLEAQTRPGGRFTLSGTVVDGTSKQPLSGVEVALQTQKWEEAAEPVTSDAQGRFGFGGLAAGEYILSASGSGFGTVRYGEAPDPGWVSTVHVGGGAGDKSVVFAIVPRASVEGVIRDEFGDPMMNADVSIMRPLWRNGRATMVNAGGKSTDDRGFYRFANLAPGNYIICTVMNGGAAPAPGPVDLATHVEGRSYIRTCYPAAGGASSRTFQLTPGQRAQIDLTPMIGSTATVRGRVRNGPPQMGFGVYLEPEDAIDAFHRNFGGSVEPSQGTFVIRGVPPGRYRLRADVHYADPGGGGQRQLSAEVPVDIGGSDVDGLDLALDAAGTVNVALHGLTENRIDPTTVNATLQRADSLQGGRAASRQEDGSFRFDGLPPGRYWIDARTSAETCVESIKVGDREVRDTTLDVAAGAAVRADVTISKNCGSIRMRAVRDGEAVPEAKTVLLLRGTAKDPSGLKEDFTNDEGEYSFSGLPPGRYLLWAWPVQGKGAMAGPSSLAAVEQQATVVEVRAGEPVHVDVPVLQDGGKGQ